MDVERIRTQIQFRQAYSGTEFVPFYREPDGGPRLFARAQAELACEILNRQFPECEFRIYEHWHIAGQNMLAMGAAA